MLDAHASSGDFTIKGKTKNNYLYCHGTAFIHCEEFSSNYLGVTNNSTGNFTQGNNFSIPNLQVAAALNTIQTSAALDKGELHGRTRPESESFRQKEKRLGMGNGR